MMHGIMRREGRIVRSRQKYIKIQAEKGVQRAFFPIFSGIFLNISFELMKKQNMAKTVHF